MKILLSDSCPIFLEGMKSVLEQEGYDVVATDVSANFCHLFSNDYDLAIMDLDLLKCHAIDLANKVMASSNLYDKSIKLIASYKEAAQYYIAYLFNAGLRKPFTKEKLLETINKEYENVKRFNYQTSGRFNDGIYYQNMV